MTSILSLTPGTDWTEAAAGGGGWVVVLRSGKTTTGQAPHHECLKSRLQTVL